MNDYENDNGNENGNDISTLAYRRQQKRVTTPHCLSKKESAKYRQDIATLKKAELIQKKFRCGVRNGGCIDRIQSMIKPICKTSKAKRHK